LSESFVKQPRKAAADLVTSVCQHEA